MPRHFLAVWPDARSAAALAEVGVKVAAESGGKAVPAQKIHLTLAFLGEIDAAAHEAALDAANSQRSRPFGLAVDTIGSFKRARVGWAGLAHPPAGLLDLQSALDSALRARGFALDRRPFAPHITLARKIARTVPPGSIPEIAWQVDAFTLVRSDTGTGRYVVEERWELGI